MKRTALKLALLLMLTGSCIAQTVLPPEVIARLSTCVFEVVTKKSEEDPLSYEKPLPFERLPYAERTDKYNSIGTAFLMEDGYLYTAQHVLQLESKLFQDEFFIRDTEGNVYPVDTIIKFATDRDFVIFTAKDLPLTKEDGLKFNESLSLNSQVFTVGNAQGEGVVIRDGMFTSRTPETQNGEWRWLRFSAAASPGNSGGPLVDKNGDVVGIITMKNQTENLNYALPISEVKNTPDGKGIVKYDLYYRLANIEAQNFFKQYDFEVTVPAPIKTVREEAWKKMQDTTQNHASGLYQRFGFTGKDSFVQNDKDNSIFITNYAPDFPLFFCLASNGKWGAYYDETSSLRLEDNGVIYYLDFLGLQMAQIVRPTSITEEELITNPKLYMDYFLKADPMYRYVGTEAVKITSYGEPAYETKYTDTFGRTWLVSQWDVPWADTSVLAYALPLPQGIFVMSVFDDVYSIENGWNTDMPYLTDFCVPSYTGTVAQWDEYLSLPQDVYPRHDIFKGAKFIYNDENVDINFAPLSLKFDAKVADIKNPDADTFTLAYAYRTDKKKGLRQEASVAAISINENTDDYRYIMEAHYIAPSATATKQTVDNYNRVKNRIGTYNGEPYNSGQYTYCDVVYNIKGDSLYLLGLELSGANKNEQMAEYRDSLMDAMGIKR